MSTIGRPSGTYQTGDPVANFAYWAKMAAWEISEGAALLVGVNPDLVRLRREWRESVGSATASRYKGVLNLAERAFEHGELGYPAPVPRQWLEWAKKKIFLFPKCWKLKSTKCTLIKSCREKRRVYRASKQKMLA